MEQTKSGCDQIGLLAKSYLYAEEVSQSTNEQSVQRHSDQAVKDTPQSTFS